MRKRANDRRVVFEFREKRRKKQRIFIEVVSRMDANRTFYIQCFRVCYTYRFTPPRLDTLL
jgi:hypothetical protein